jgi:putative ABC transport system permease protein
MTPMARLATPDRVRALDLEPTSITAVIVGLKSRPAVLRLQRNINTYTEEPLQAVIPGVALSQLWEVVGIVEQTLAVISACVVVVGLIVVLVSIMTALNERRREMAILRSVGARPGDVFFLLVAEAALLAITGALAGLALLYGGLAILQPVIQRETGITILGLQPGSFDLAVVIVVTLAAALLACLPAWRAYRNSLADGLSIRT